MMAVILLVAVCAMGIGVGLALTLGGIAQIERQREIYPAISVCAPSRHNQLTGAYQVSDDYESDLYAAGLVEEIDELERDAHEYRQEIRRLTDELAELRFPVAPVATTASRYSVIDRFAYLEVRE